MVNQMRQENQQIEALIRTGGHGCDRISLLGIAEAEKRRRERKRRERFSSREKDDEDEDEDEDEQREEAAAKRTTCRRPKFLLEKALSGASLARWGKALSGFDCFIFAVDPRFFNSIFFLTSYRVLSGLTAHREKYNPLFCFGELTYLF